MGTTRRKSSAPRTPQPEPGRARSGAERAPAGVGQPPRGWLKLLAYAIALFPPTGFLLGVIYYPQGDPVASRFGRNCMILAVLGLVGLCFCWGASGLFKGLQAAGSNGVGNGYY